MLVLQVNLDLVTWTWGIAAQDVLQYCVRINSDVALLSEHYQGGLRMIADLKLRHKRKTTNLIYRATKYVRGRIG